ncbi:MAG: serine/threonine protein kinase [Deltaproteobacteria bacterium]|nr:serine/threonine protein kinase [Deltaproteobacteria bacterium]
MADKRDLQLVRIAVKRRWITAEEGEDCLFLKEKFGGKFTTEEIFRRRNYLSEEQLAKLLIEVPPARTEPPPAAAPRKPTKVPTVAPKPPVEASTVEVDQLATRRLDLPPERQKAPPPPPDDDGPSPYDDEVTMIAEARPVTERPPEPMPVVVPRPPSVARPIPRAPSTIGAMAKESFGVEPTAPDEAPRRSWPAVVPSPLDDMDDPGVREAVIEERAHRKEAGELAEGGSYGPYKILRTIARGGTGTVYLAQREGLGAAVALKVLSRKSEKTRSVVERFVRGTKAGQQIRSEHVVPVIDSGVIEGRHYVAMPYVDGWTLRERLESGDPPDVRESLRITRGIARALESAHALGILHRDLKPEAVLISRDGTVFLTDFGLAKDTRSAEPQLTQVGETVYGAAEYVSPEQAIGAAVDVRADLYSLGALLFHMLTGDVMFRGSSQVSIVTKHIRGAAPLDRLDRSLPEPVQRLVSRLLQKMPSERYATATELLTDLRAVRQLVEEIDPDRRRRESNRSAALKLCALKAAAVSLGGLVVALALPLGVTTFKPSVFGSRLVSDYAFFGASAASTALGLFAILALIQRGRLPLPGSTTWLVTLRDAAGAVGAGLLVSGIPLAPPAGVSMLVSAVAAIVLISWLYGTMLRRTVAALRPDRGVGHMLAVLRDENVRRWGWVHAPLVTSLAVLSAVRFALLAYFHASGGSA